MRLRLQEGYKYCNYHTDLQRILHLHLKYIEGQAIAWYIGLSVKLYKYKSLQCL